MAVKWLSPVHHSRRFMLVEDVRMKQNKVTILGASREVLELQTICNGAKFWKVAMLGFHAATQRLQRLSDALAGENEMGNKIFQT